MRKTSETDTETSEESSSYYSSSTASSVVQPSRQQRSHDDMWKKSFNQGKRRYFGGREVGRVAYLNQVQSSDELVKSSSVVKTRTKEAWRTKSKSAWMLFDLSGLCEVWGIVISWWGNCHADYVKLFAALDEDGEYWDQLTGVETHFSPTFDRVTRIDFKRICTAHIRLDLIDGHPDFLSKGFFFGIREISIVGCRPDIKQPEWISPDRDIVERGRRKINRDEQQDVVASLDEHCIPKQLYMPGEALKKAKDICREGRFPQWDLVMESGILEQYQVWPGTKDKSRLQTPLAWRWTEKDPCHPFYWMSPRERRKKYHAQEQCMPDDEFDTIFEEHSQKFRTESRSDLSPASSRPSSAQFSRPASAHLNSARGFRPSTPSKNASRASTRPTTADTSRAGTRPSSAGLYGSRGVVRPNSASAYSMRFGSRPSTPGTYRIGLTTRDPIAETEP